MRTLQEFLNKNFTDKAILIFLLCLSLLIWLNVFSFFLGDDWSFINDFANGKSFKEYALVGHGGHVIPLFQALYTMELVLFGKNAICLQFTSVLFWGLTCFVFYLLLNRMSTHEYAKRNSLIITIVFCLHPDLADVIFWIFQQGVILHILLQLLAVLYYFNYIQQGHFKNFVLFLFFLVIQNYFFGNGVLFPLLFICHYFFEKRKIDKLIICTLLIQLLFIFIQKALSQQEINLNTLLENYTSIIISFFKLIYVSIVRFAFVKQTGGSVLVYIGLVFFAYLCYLAYRDQKNYFIFCILYLFVSSLAVPIARFQIAGFQPQDVHYYYSVLLFPPLFLILYLAISHIQVKGYNLLFSICLVYTIGFYFINIQTKKIFGYKHFKNKEAIENAVLYGKKNYYAFEDGSSARGKQIYQTFLLNPEIQKSIQKTDYFASDSSIIEYLSDSVYTNFIIQNTNILNSYKILKEKSLFNLDINYEKK